MTPTEPGVPRPPFTRAEAVGAAIITLLASASVAAYLADAIGARIFPSITLAVAACAAGATCAAVWRRADRDPADLAAFAAVVVVIVLWLLRLAPDWLPPGTGPDLTHHLLLVNYIDLHWRLPHDAQLGAYLGEMVDYTPGSHLLASLAGAWLRSDGLHAIYPLLAFSVAIKAGIVFLIARRLVPAGAPTTACALVSIALLTMPYEYFVGSFAERSFLAQVVSECFAVALWWTVVVWDAWPAALPAILFGLFGAAVFLAWPVWIGPPLIVFALCFAFRNDLSPRNRAVQTMLATLPICVVAALHAAASGRSAEIVGATGFVVRPSPAVFGWVFLVACAGGLCLCFTRRTRTVPMLLAAIALQAVALAAFANSRGSAAPYIALKMVHLAIYPLAVAGAVGVAAGILTLMEREPWSSGRPTAAALVCLVFAAAAGRTLLLAPKPHPVITEAMFQAGRWAREHVTADCVDYLTEDSYGAYWLHLAVMGNPRAGGRSEDPGTFEPRDAVARWIEPRGLPYAIAQDFPALPKDIRENVDVAARFGPAAVIKRRTPSACETTTADRTPR